MNRGGREERREEGRREGGARLTPEGETDGLRVVVVDSLVMRRERCADETNDRRVGGGLERDADQPLDERVGSAVETGDSGGAVREGVGERGGDDDVRKT